MELDKSVQDRNLERLERKYEYLINNGQTTADCYVFLAEVLLKRDKSVKAIKILNEGLSKNKDNITAKYLLGKTYYNSWMIDNAKTHLEEVLRLCPDNLGAAKIIIEIYKSEEHIGKALAVINNILNYYPSNKDLLNLRDKLASDLNAKSIEAFSPSNTRANQDSQNSADDSGIRNSLTSKTIAELYMKQGLLKDAILELKRIFDENPNDDSIREKISKLQSYVLSESSGFEIDTEELI